MSKKRRNPSEPLTKRHGAYSRNGLLHCYITRLHYKPISRPPYKRPGKGRIKVRAILTPTFSRSNGISKHRRRTNGHLTFSLSYSFASDHVFKMLCFIYQKIGTKWYRQRCTTRTSFKQSREQKTTYPAQQTKDITPRINRDIENGLTLTVHPLTLVGAGGGTVEASEDEVVTETQIINHIQTGVNSTQNHTVASEATAQHHQRKIVALPADQQITG